MNFLSILGTALCGFAISSMVKQLNPGFSMYISVGTYIVLVVLSFGYLAPVVDFLAECTSGFGLGTYGRTIQKLLAIGIITSVASSICSDAGEGSIANGIELVGKGAAALTVLPVLKSLVVAVRDFLT